MPEIELLAAIAVGVVLLGGSIAFGLALSRSSMKALRERVAVHNAAIRGLADRLALPCAEPGPYRHPIVGDVPSYARIVGTHGGRALRVEVQSDEDSADLVLVLTPSPGRTWPKLGRVDPGRDAERHPALALLDGRAKEVRVTSTELRVLPTANDPRELHATLDAALALATALDARPPA